MGKSHFYVLALFLLGILDSSVDGLRHFRHDRIRKKIKDSEPNKFERWFTQHLDHFNPKDEREWQQRYFVNDELFNTTSRNVAFLQIEGEGEASTYFMTNGAWYLNAKECKPILFVLEHRYLGKSHPTEDVSTENLVYLTSQQALADVAFFIEGMNKKYKLSSDVKWILFGGSYAGSLAAWMRQKYPHLVHGAMSASGPLLAKLDFPEYYKGVQDALRSNSDDCANAVQAGTGQIESLLRHKSGQQKIDKIFNLCHKIELSINNPLDVSNFYDRLADNFAGVIQYNHEDDSIRLNTTTEKLCDIMTNKSLGAEVNRLAAVNSFLLETSNMSCLDYKYDRMMDDFRNTSWDARASDGERQWFYLTCTEFGFYQTSSYEPHIFGNHCELDFYVKQCQDLFGPKFNKTFLDNVVKRTNVLYGGWDIEVTNVVFVHGSLDPWHALGITQTRNKGAPAILIEGASHCLNMQDPADYDSPQLTAARVQIKDIIASWLEL